MIHFMHANLLEALPPVVVKVESVPVNCPEPCDCDLCTEPKCFCQDCQAERADHEGGAM